MTRLLRRRKEPKPEPQQVPEGHSLIPWFVGLRTTWYVPDLDARNGVYPPNDMARTEVPYEKANLVGSLVAGDMHLPVFDLDFPAHLIESSTKGHYHLYLNKPVTWRQYKRLLRAMHSAGMIEKGFCHLSVQRGCAFLRKPGVRKITRPGRKPIDI